MLMILCDLQVTGYQLRFQKNLLKTIKKCLASYGHEEMEVAVMLKEKIIQNVHSENIIPDRFKRFLCVWHKS